MNILIVKMSSLGDIIHTFPVIQYLKQHCAQAQIDWVVEQPFAELVQAHPLVNRVLCVQTKKWRSQLLKMETWQEMARFRRELRRCSYDVVLDLQGNMKSGIVTASAQSPLKVGFGRSSVSEWPNLLVTHQHYNPPADKNVYEENLFLAQSVLGGGTSPVDRGVQLKLSAQQQIQLKPVLEELQQVQALKVMVCPGSNWANKQLSLETLQSFLQKLSERLKSHFLFIWGHQEEKILVDRLAADFPGQSMVIDKLPLPALQNLMAHCHLILAMDSLPLHLAGTTSTPTYSVFGASSASKYQPMGRQHKAFQGSCPYGKTFSRRCHLLRTCPTGACIKGLQGQTLFDHFFDWWSSINLNMEDL